MKKISVMLVLASVLMSFIIGATAEPVLPKYVVPLNNRTNIRSETSRTGDNIILEVDVDDVLQVIGYSYDMEGNLWWRVIDYQSNEDGYAIAILFGEINESQATERKKQIDTGMNPQMTALPLISESDATSLYIITIADKANFRRTPGITGTSLDRIPFGSSLIMFGEESDGTYTWYKTNYNGQDGYVRSDMVKVLTSTQLQDYLAGKEVLSTTKSSDYNHDKGYDYDKGYGYTAPNAGESLSDYIKRQDLQLYEDMRDNWNSLTGKDTPSVTKSNDYDKQSSSANYDRHFSDDEIQDFINLYNGKW